MEGSKELEKTITPLTLKIKRREWEMFKDLVPRKVTLNEAIVQLIKKHIKENSEINK